MTRQSVTPLSWQRQDNSDADPGERKAYHHGDLRRALLTAALAVLEEGGLEALSLRRVAADLGVSHAAPTHHFPTLRHLRTALAVEGFRRFAAAMVDERARSAPEPLAQLQAAERGYLVYAGGQPALFRLMFNKSLLDWGDSALAEAAGAAYQQLAEVAAPASDRLGLESAADREAVEHLLWSQIHGRAHLMIDGKLSPEAAAREGPVSVARWLFPDGPPLVRVSRSRAR
jgi:AcrR family transcriptional regulator